VIVINETLARQLAENGAVLGRRLRVPVGRTARTAEIIGVVRDSKYYTLGEGTLPIVYLPFRQAYSREMTVHIRTTDMKAASAAIRRELQRLAPDVFVEVRSMVDAVSVAVLPARVGALGTVAFGTVAMLLAALGIYGLVSFVVVQRTRDIGVRIVVGATTSDVLRLVIAENMSSLWLGLAIGVPLAIVGALPLRYFLTGVSPVDIPSVLLATVVMTSVGVLASAVPAWRAAKIDPLGSLRSA
jgi:putative ABC transport system permease protein